MGVCTMLLNAEPPLCVAPRELFENKARIYFRVDNILLRLIHPFAQSLAAVEQQGRAPTSEDYKEFGKNAVVAFQTVTAKEVTQWALASACVWSEHPFLRQVGYQYDVMERMKVYYLNGALQSVNIGPRVCKFLLGTFRPPTPEELAYDLEANPAKKAMQQLLLTSIVNYIAACATLLNEARAIHDQDRRKKHTLVGLAKYTAQSTVLFCARVGAAVVGHLSGPTGMILADIVAVSLCGSANPYIGTFVKRQVTPLLETA